MEQVTLSCVTSLYLVSASISCPIICNSFMCLHGWLLFYGSNSLKAMAVSNSSWSTLSLYQKTDALVTVCDLRSVQEWYLFQGVWRGLGKQYWINQNLEANIEESHMEGKREWIITEPREGRYAERASWDPRDVAFSTGMPSAWSKPHSEGTKLTNIPASVSSLTASVSYTLNPTRKPEGDDTHGCSPYG